GVGIRLRGLLWPLQASRRVDALQHHGHSTSALFPLPRNLAAIRAQLAVKCTSYATHLEVDDAVAFCKTGDRNRGVTLIETAQARRGALSICARNIDRNPKFDHGTGLKGASPMPFDARTPGAGRLVGGRRKSRREGKRNERKQRLKHGAGFHGLFARFEK